MDNNNSIKKIIDSLVGSAEPKVFFGANLEELGIHAVKARLESKYWGSTHNIAWAKEWIESKEAPEKAKLREEELNILKETNAIAKDANSIATEANRKSDFSNRLSVLAVFVSLLAALIAWLVK